MENAENPTPETPKDISSEISWVDDLIVKLQANVGQVMSIEVGGTTISAIVDQAAVKFFTDNKPLLINIGKDLFASFLTLLNEGKQEEAFNILLEKMDADAIIARLRMDAAELQKYNDDRDAFWAALKKWALQTLSMALSKVIVGLLLPLIP